LVSHSSYEHKLRASENRVLRRSFLSKREEVTGEWRKLRNEELHNLYSSLNLYKNNADTTSETVSYVTDMPQIIKQKFRHRPAKKLVFMYEHDMKLKRKQSHNMLEKGHLENQEVEDIIKMDVRETGCEDGRLK
jgi:hypothetical protein